MTTPQPHEDSMNADEAETHQLTERKPLELCGDQPERGKVCMLRRGHEGNHACFTEGGFACLYWRRRR